MVSFCNLLKTKRPNHMLKIFLSPRMLFLAHYCKYVPSIYVETPCFSKCVLFSIISWSRRCGEWWRIPVRQASAFLALYTMLLFCFRGLGLQELHRIGLCILNSVCDFNLV